MLTLHLCLLALGYPYQLDYGEGLVLHQALVLARGESIYKAIDTYPYIFSNYPPLVQALASPLVAVAGASFPLTRTLGVAATLGLGAILYALLRRAGASGLAAIVAALLFLGSPYIYHWAPLLRIDLPALLLSALGMLALVSPARPSAQRLTLAAVLFVLAIFAKQSYIAAPAATVAYLAFNNRPALRRFVVTLAIGGLVPFVALELATAGAFSFGLFTANVNPFNAAILFGQLTDFGRTFAPIIILAIIGAAPARRLPQTLLGWYGLFAVATVLLAGKVGAWENYFFEALFVLCVYAGLGIDRLLRIPCHAERSEATRTGDAEMLRSVQHDSGAAQHGSFSAVAQEARVFAQTLVPLALIAQLALMWHDPRIAMRVVQDDGAANRALAPLIAGQSGMILSEDVGLLLVNGKEIPYFSFQYAQLAAVGRWDQHWEIENLTSGRFDLVVLEKGTREQPERYSRFTRPVLSAIDAAYGLVAEVGKYRVYAPAPLQRAMDASFGNLIALRGYRLDAPAAAGDTILVPPSTVALPSLNPYPARLRLTLLWQALAPMDMDYKVFVHLEDAGGARRAQSDAVPFFGLYPPSRWTTGELVRDYLDLDLPAGLPSGRYALRVGLYDPASGQRLPLPGGQTSLLLAALPVGALAPAALPTTSLRAAFAGGVSLSGYDLPTARLSAGAPLTVTLYWQTDRYIERDATVFVHLAGQDGQPLAQGDSQPQNGAYPTSLWNPGDVVADTHTLTIPPNLPAGSYRLLVGLYDPLTLARTLLADGSDSVEIDAISVAP